MNLLNLNFQAGPAVLTSDYLCPLSLNVIYVIND